MRIVYFLPDVEAGVAQVVRNLLKYRPLTQVEYVVVLMHHKEADEERRISDDFNAVKTIRFIYDPLDNVYCVYEKMGSILNPDDVIVGNDGYEIRMVAALQLKNPVVYILHGDNSYYHTICKLNQNIIDLFIAISNKTFQLLQENLDKQNRTKVRQIYYPSSAVENLQVVKEKSGIFKIVYVSELIAGKGAHLLWDIYNKIKYNIPEFTVEIIGDGDLKEQLIKRFAGVENVIIWGKMSNQHVMQKFEESHVFLFPSYSEGLPNVLIEALSKGAVPVSSNLPSGVRDVIVNEENGLLVPVGDVEAFGKAITYLYHNPMKLQAMRKCGRDALNKFEPWQQAKVYHEKIANLANESKSLPKRKFPVYPMGGWMNKTWIPNAIVRLIRMVIKHPKL